MRVVAHEIPHPVAQECAGPADLGVGRGSRRVPAVRAPTAGRALVGAREPLEGLPRQHATGGRARGDARDGPVEPRDRQRSPREKPAKHAMGRAVPPAIWRSMVRMRPSRILGRAVVDGLAVIAHPRRAARIGAPERRQFSLCPVGHRQNHPSRRPSQSDRRLPCGPASGRPIRPAGLSIPLGAPSCASRSAHVTSGQRSAPAIQAAARA